MLSAVKLNDKPMLNRSEVGNERTDRHLASKLHAIQRTVAQQPPYGTRGVGSIAAK
jgi:hypothetical protein